MTTLKEATAAYTTALRESCTIRRQLMLARQALILLDAELSEEIADAKDAAAKALYSNADSRKAALLNHPRRQEPSESLHRLEVTSLETDTAVEVAKVQWQTERLILATDKGVVSL